MSDWWSKRARRLSRLRHPGELVLFGRITLFAALVPVLLRLELPALRSLLPPRRVPAWTDVDRVARIARLTDAALGMGWPFVRRGCLIRGVTLYYFISRTGLPVSLCFGMGQVDGQFAGHCWLINDGEPFLEQHDPRALFTPVYAIP